MDDTAADEREDMLAEMAFHVPQGHAGLTSDNAEEAPAKVWTCLCVCVCVFAGVFTCVWMCVGVGG